MVQNFLYCFDSNYNTQATLSMYSLLEHVEKKINIFIIHKESNYLSSLNEKIKNHKNLGAIEVFKFNQKNIKFPNLANNHISEATYYRLFISTYLPKNLDFITYLDADTICTNNPTQEIENIQRIMVNRYSVSVKTEITRNEWSESLFKNLDMKNNNYFNAGVMIINLEEWYKNNIENIAQKKIVTLANKLKFWDQDILNSIFDGNYHELKSTMNSIISLDTNKKDYKNQVKIFSNQNLPQIIHYAGSSKPWSLEGIFLKDSMYYQQIYTDVYSKKYHLEIKWKTHAIKTLINNLKNRNILFIEYPLALLWRVFVEVLKK